MVWAEYNSTAEAISINYDKHIGNGGIGILQMCPQDCDECMSVFSNDSKKNGEAFFFMLCTLSFKHSVLFQNHILLTPLKSGLHNLYFKKWDHNRKTIQTLTYQDGLGTYLQ